MEKTFKRTTKTVSPEVREKVANSLRGKARPENVKAKISQGMKRYWNTPSNFPDDIRHEGTGNGFIETGDVV